VQKIITAIKQYVDGHINESVEHRNFWKRVQQRGETFDDYLVALRELVKACNFCSPACTAKNIRDQLIEGILDGNTIEHLLQQHNLTLDTAITTCIAEEAAKRQRSEITLPQSDTILAVRQKEPHHKKMTTQPSAPTYLGCRGKPHQGGCSRCPAYSTTCHYCQKVGHYACVCHAKQARQPPLPPSARQIQLPANTDVESEQFHLYTIKQSDPAPTIPIHLTALNCSTDVLPDSGADISAASTPLLTLLNDHVHNLIPIPHTANGHKMYHLRYLPITFKLGTRQFTSNVHIYPNITGTILSWKASKALGILPECFPSSVDIKLHPQLNVHATTFVPQSSPIDSQTLITEFPSVFDNQIRSMDGEQFHISLTCDAKSFCIKVPRSILFAYRDMLKDELDLLLSQNIIAPVTTVTEPIVVTPKKNSDRIRMCMDLSHLNKHLLRERFQSSTPAQAVADIAATDAKIFMVLDALKVYHQCPIDESSQLLTTFITVFG